MSQTVLCYALRPPIGKFAGSLKSVCARELGATGVNVVLDQSGLPAEAIARAARPVRLGDAECVVAGGMEDMDQGPYLLDRARWRYRMGLGTLADATLCDGLNDAFSGEHSGWHTEDLVENRHISRAVQDAWPARSQQRFPMGKADGRFTGEIVPVTVNGRKGETELTK